MKFVGPRLDFLLADYALLVHSRCLLMLKSSFPFRKDTNTKELVYA